MIFCSFGCERSARDPNFKLEIGEGCLVKKFVKRDDAEYESVVDSCAVTVSDNDKDESGNTTLKELGLQHFHLTD